MLKDSFLLIKRISIVLIKKSLIVMLQSLLK
nr:MAG TPA: hypothetical protein [Crassvirales sp.]